MCNNQVNKQNCVAIGYYCTGLLLINLLLYHELMGGICILLNSKM